MANEFPKNNPPEKIALPTPGRIVLYFENDKDVGHPAMVAETVEGSHTIQIMHVFQHDGMAIAESVPHKGDATKGLPYWDWMPYQKGQAAKTEQLSEELTRLRGAVGGPTTMDPGPAVGTISEKP